MRALLTMNNLFAKITEFQKKIHLIYDTVIVIGVIGGTVRKYCTSPHFDCMTNIEKIPRKIFPLKEKIKKKEIRMIFFRKIS